MNKKNLFTFLRDDATDDAITNAENITLTQIDEAQAAGQPDTIDKAWHEMEYDKLAAEQRPRWLALGEKVARPYIVLAAKWQTKHDIAQHQIVIQQDEFAKAKTNLELHDAALQGFTRREPHAKFLYLLRWFLLLLGDIAGITGAAVLLGEIPSLAALQAVASAIAAVTAGLAGTDIRDARLARRRARDPHDLPEEHRRFTWVFNGADTGEKIVKAMILAALSITLLTVGGIATLRIGAEDSLAGMVFGCLAGAICLASLLNTYNYADEITDLLDLAYARYLRASKRLMKLSNSKSISTFAAAAATGESITREHQEHATAGELKFNALMHGISRLNPAVMGHGPAAHPTTTMPHMTETAAVTDEKPMIDTEKVIITKPIINMPPASASDLSAMAPSLNGHSSNGSRP